MSVRSDSFPVTGGEQHAVPRLPASGRARAATPFVLVGTACVVAGGMVAAVTAHHATEHASWAAAYLVLVAGVMQVALGAGRAQLAASVPSGRVVAVEFAAWNLGNAAVLAGTLLTLTPLVDAGGVLLVVALVLWLLGVRGPTDRYPRWWRYGYRLLIAALAVSIPIGLVLAAVDG